MSENTQTQKKTPMVYISPYYIPDDKSGGNRRFDELCKRFCEEYGQNFTLVVSKGMTPTWWNGTSKLVEVDYKFNHISKFKAAHQIAKFLNSIPPSIVVLESIPIPFRALKKHAHFQVAYDFRYFSSASKSFLYRLVFSQYLKYQWRNPEFFVTSTESSISELQKYVGYPRERIIKSYFGIDEGVLDLARSTPPAKEYDIIYVGHYEKRKNHEPLMRAIAKLDPSLRVYFLGRDTGLLESLLALKEELKLVNTTIATKSLSDSDLWNMYRKSRVFAYPSIYEGFGIPLIEAMALDIPVVCTNMDVFHEVSGELASFFNPYDPDDIAKKLQQALSSPTTPSPEAVRDQLQKFFWSNIYAKFEADLRNFAERKLK